jgi:chromosome segregation ATPase
LNECSVSADEAIKTFQKLKLQAQENYTKRVNQKMQKSTVFLKEAIVNLEAHHTLKDLKPIIKKLEKYGFKVLQTSIHRDEGFLNSENKKEKNYHAHITMFNLDVETGKTVKFGKNYRSELSKLQTFVADTLQMQRGKVSVKQEVKRLKKKKNIDVKLEKATRRLDTHDYKRAMKIKEQEELKLQEKYNFREMQKKITALENLTNEQKRELHQLNSKVKNDKAKIAELQAKLQALSTANDTLNKENEAYKQNIAHSQEKIASLEAREPEVIKVPVEKVVIKKVEDTEKIDELHKTLINAHKTIKQQNASIDTLKAENEAYKRNIAHLQAQKQKVEIREVEKIVKVVDTEKIDDLQHKLKTAVADVKELSKSILQRDISNISDIQEAKQTAKQLHKSLISQRETIKQQKTSIDTLKDDLRASERNMSDLQAQNRQLLAREPEVREKVRVEYRTDDAALMKLQKENKELKAEVEELKSWKEQVIDYFKDLAKSINTKATFDSFREKVISLFKQNKELKKENKELLETVADKFDFNDLVKEAEQKQKQDYKL